MVNQFVFIAMFYQLESSLQHCSKNHDSWCGRIGHLKTFLVSVLENRNCYCLKRFFINVLVESTHTHMYASCQPMVQDLENRHGL